MSCSNQLNTTLGYFAGTTFVAMIGEIFARKFKMPATTFIFPAVIPMVPGFGLYQTMLALVQNEIQINFVLNTVIWVYNYMLNNIKI